VITIKRLLKPVSLLIVSIFLVLNAFASNAQGLDKNFVSWKEHLREGSYNRVIKQAEKNLASEQPHPYAINAWVTAHKAMGSLEKALGAGREKWRQQVNQFIDTENFYDKEQSYQLYEQYVTSGLNELHEQAWSNVIITISELPTEPLKEHLPAFLDKPGLTFRTVWAVSNLMEKNEKIRRWLAEQFQKGKFDTSTLAGRFIYRQAVLHQQDEYDFVALLDDETELLKTDALANRFIAHQLRNLERYEEAQKYYQRSFDLNPFYDLNLLSLAETSARLSKFDEAEQKLKMAARLYAPNDTNRYFLQKRAALYLEIEHLGKTRSSLKTALAQFPDDTALNFLRGRLELESGNPEVAIPFLQKAIQAVPDHLEYQEYYLKALKEARMLEEFLMAYEQLTATVKVLSPAIYNDISEMYVMFEEYDLALETVNQAIEYYVESGWLYREKALVLKKLNNFQSAIETLETSFMVDEPYSWPVQELVRLMDASNMAKSDQIEKLKNLADTYQWIEEIWEKWADLENTREAKLQIWKLAMERNTMALFPYENVFRNLHGKEWNRALENLEQLTTLVQKEEAGNKVRVNLHFEKGIIYISKLRNEGLTDQEFKKALAHFNDYLQAGGRPGAYYQYVYELYISQGRSEEAAQALRKWILYRPNQGSNRRYTITEIPGEFPDGFAIFGELIDRQPHDWKHWASLIQLNTLYGGSAINAIRLGQEFEQRFPNRKNEVQSYVGSAYGHLGNSIKHFEDFYGKANAIGKSQRYINWFLSTKRDAWKDNTQLNFDWDTNTATLLFEDGTIGKLTDDPRTSRTTKVQVGDTYIEARYNDEIMLTEIRRSDGASVKLSYNEEGKIIEMQSTAEETMAFAYDSLTGKPNQIIIQANPPDTIFVDYFETGEIDSVHSTSGNKTALKFQNAFQSLLSYTQIFKEATQSITNGELPELGLTDAHYTELKSAANQYDARIDTKIEFANYLIDHTTTDPDYGEEALSVIENLFYSHKDSEGEDIKLKLVDLIRMNYTLLMKIRTQGIEQDTWNTWADMQKWLIIRQADKEKSKNISTLLEEIEEHPLELLPSSKWLPKSDLYNNSYWKTFDFKALIDDQLHEDFTINTAFIRNSGDILLGTNKGLLVYHKGYWQHLAYNFIGRSFQNSLPKERIKATSDILAIGENDKGILYLGTADGLFALDKYRGKVTERTTIADGLPSNTITHIEFFQNKVLVATPKGVMWFSPDLKQVQSKVLNQEVLFTDIEHNGNRLLLGTNKGILLIDDKASVVQLYNEPRTDGMFSSDGKEVYTLKGQQVWVKEVDDDTLSPKEYALNGELITTQAAQVYGLTEIYVNPDIKVPAVQTDIGLSIYHENHYEHYYLDRETGARARYVTQKKDQLIAVTDNNVRIFRRDLHDKSNNPVKDLLSFKKMGFSVIADGGNPKIIEHKDPENTILELYPNDYLNTTVLAKESDSTLVLNNGRQIMRYVFNTDSASYRSQELFYALSNMPANRNLYDDPAIKNIVIGDDGSVWVATENAVLRYVENKNGEADVQEFNYFKNQDIFPCYSDRTYRIFKTISGDIYAVCSNEGHRYYRGVSLKGGLLKFQPQSNQTVNDDRFVRVDTEDATFNWFVHAYTPVDDDKAIMATASGFAVAETGGWKGLKFWEQNDSYNAVYEKHQNLFLGTQGAALDDLWLFGSADGLIAYYDDHWFYPSRINAQLPKDREFGKYGGRHVNAVATSSNGKIYVGTDLGLLVYDSESSDPSKFIMDNYSIESSIEFFNKNIVKKEQERIFSLKDIPEESDTGRLIKTLKQTNHDISHLQHHKDRIDDPVELVSPLGKDTGLASDRVDSLDAELKILNQKQSELLLTLQQQEPTLYQTIQIDPLNLRSSRFNMNEDDVVVQYLPMSRKLFIQVLSKNSFQLREVEVSSDALMDSVRLVSSDLSYKAGTLRAESLGGSEQSTMRLSEERLKKLLSYLYEHLLRPVEKDITDYGNIYIAPVGTLNYLPFSALIDNQGERDFTYAAERYNIGYVSSMYLFNLIYNERPTPLETALLIGDPDGTLAGALDEVKEIQKLVDRSRIYTGKEANTEVFHQYAEQTNIIHLATHGFLNEESLKKSWLLFADKKFILSEVYNLNLRNNVLLVLSACETSLGGEGLEYATLSRAFLNAGTPSIVGTLWKVDDRPSKELMVYFYRFLMQGHNKFRALAMAKRALIGSNDSQLNHPSKWASYIMIGKP